MKSPTQSRPSDAGRILSSAIAAASETIQGLRGLESQVAGAADLISKSLIAGNKLLVCGNGGSAADASDFCTEFVCRFLQDRRPYPALNLTPDGSLLTATGNDYGFDETFGRQISAFAQTGDVLIAISTSGKSANVRRALETGKERGLITISLLGRDGGTAAGIADVELLVQGDSTARIQEAHKFLLHVLCEICEGRLPR